VVEVGVLALPVLVVGHGAVALVGVRGAVHGLVHRELQVVRSDPVALLGKRSERAEIGTKAARNPLGEVGRVYSAFFRSKSLGDGMAFRPGCCDRLSWRSGWSAQ
jgi:hypothetical protein